jgi:DNA-binding transcriptional MerR regulator
VRDAAALTNPSSEAKCAILKRKGRIGNYCCISVSRALFPLEIYQTTKILDIVVNRKYHTYMESASFSTNEAAQLVGFTTRQLDYWASQRIIVPSVQQSSGPGSRKRYSVEDLIRLKFVRQLKRYGWSTQKVGQAIATLRQVMDDPDPLRSAILIHGKGTIFALCKTKRGERILLDGLHAGGQQVMPIILEKLHEEIYISAAQADKIRWTWQPSLPGIEKVST